MAVDPNADTHSPWYECFEPQAQGVVQAAPLPAIEASAPATDTAAAADTDWAVEALFDYYNA